MSTEPADPASASLPAVPPSDEPRLVATPTGLPPHFPDEERGTGAVLYGAGPGTLHVHWRLDPDVWAQAAGSFPVDSARPEPVVRLRRVRPAGGSDPVAEVGLIAVAREGAGETEFRVAVDHGRYLAELGLTRPDGGWLMLARSNEADNVEAVTVDLAGLAPAAQHIEVSPELLDAEPALVRSILELPGGTFPLVRRALAGGEATQASSLAIMGVDEPLGSMTTLPFVVVPARVGGGGDAVVYYDLPGRPVHLAGQAAPAPGPAGLVAMGPIEPLAYGQAPAHGGAVQIDAELRISGQAPPGTEIDLFGQPYRVGPGGRFQLVLRLDDADLLRQALAQHPPPELTRHRDD